MVTLQEKVCGTCCMHGIIFKQLKSCVTPTKAAILGKILEMRAFFQMLHLQGPRFKSHFFKPWNFDQ